MWIIRLIFTLFAILGIFVFPYVLLLLAYGRSLPWVPTNQPAPVGIILPYLFFILSAMLCVSYIVIVSLVSAFSHSFSRFWQYVPPIEIFLEAVFIVLLLGTGIAGFAPQLAIPVSGFWGASILWGPLYLLFFVILVNTLRIGIKRHSRPE